jgi:hypothetical protein
MRAEVKRPMTCSASPCKVAEGRDGDREIRKGDAYFTWARKFGNYGQVYFRHVECGRPRMSELSSRKTVAIEEAIQDASWDFSPQVDEDGSYSGEFDEVSDTLQSIADVAREVGEEYQSSYDNLPEGLNQSETAYAMETVAQELESWADELESFEPSAEYDQPEREEGESDEDYLQRCQDDLDQWATEVVQEAEDKTSDMPEYEG